MSVTDKDKEKKRLRAQLNPYLKGKVVDAVLEALAIGNATHLVNNVAAVHDQLYIATASDRYLDERLAAYGLIRPPAVGLSDDVLREIGIAVKNRKQVRDLIHQLLDSIFGDEYVRASNPSRAFEPYDLSDGDSLTINFDDRNTVTVTFSTAEFSDIHNATAQEIADSITKSLRSNGVSGTAVAQNDGNGPYVLIYSDTVGPASSVTVLGGRAQNKLKFDSSVPAGGNTSTQWTLSLQPGGNVRYTWTGGSNPLLGKVEIGNYVNVFGGGFASSANEGSYTLTDVKGGAIDISYFEVYNPLGAPGVIVQGADDAILFYNASRKTIASRLSYAAAYQSSARVLQIFMPAATKVVRRSRKGSAHIHDPSDSQSLLPNQPGPYVFDISQPFTVSDVGTTLAQNLDGTMSRVVTVADSSLFPDSEGYLILGYGSSKQEGPIPYIARPSSNTLLISPAYTVKNSHVTGEDVALVAQKAPVDLAQDGSDYPFYVTDVVAGRAYAQELIQSIAATGITLVFTVLYPNSIGLGKWGTEFDENPILWGP